MSPRVKPKQPPALNENWEHVRNPTQAEFRSEAAKGEFPRAFSEDTAFWKYLLTPATASPLGGTVPLLESEEHRVQERGSRLQPQWFKRELRAAMVAAGIDRIPEFTHRDAAGRRRGGFRPFHDQRHSSLTHSAAAGTGEIALMTAAGHGSINITKRYLHLAGTVFRDEAEAIERRLLGGQPSTELSTNLTAPHSTSADLNARSEAESHAADLR